MISDLRPDLVERQLLREQLGDAPRLLDGLEGPTGVAAAAAEVDGRIGGQKPHLGPLPYLHSRAAGGARDVVGRSPPPWAPVVLRAVVVRHEGAVYPTRRCRVVRGSVAEEFLRDYFGGVKKRAKEFGTQEES